MQTTNVCELLVLTPRHRDAPSLLAWQRLLATLVLDGVDFAFDDYGQVPDELPDDFEPYRNILVFTEDLDHHRASLRPAFPDLDAYLRMQQEDGNRYRSTPSASGGTRLFVRSLMEMQRGRHWCSVYWAAQLRLPSPHFITRQCARSDDLVFEQHFQRIAANTENGHENVPLSRMGTIMGSRVQWCEASGIIQRTLMDLGDLTSNETYWRIGADSVNRYLQETDWNAVPSHGDPWSIVESVVQLYERTHEPRLLEFIRLRLAQRDTHWTKWRGCFGLCRDDQWLRDSTLATMCVPAVRAARLLSPSEARAIDDQAVHQCLLTEELLADPRTGLYHFGSDGRRTTPTLVGHGSYWAIFTQAMLLTHLPSEHEGFTGVADIFRKLARALARVQGPEGLWHTHPDRAESSTGDVIYTGGIVGALLRGLSLGLLDATEFEPVVRRGLDGFKLRNFAGYAVGGAVACALNPARRYYDDRYVWEEFHFGSWQQILPMVEALRYRSKQHTKEA